MKHKTDKLFFIEKMCIQSDAVVEFEHISNGWSNDVFKVRTSANTYYFRVAKPNPLINRIDEKLVLDKLQMHYCYYDNMGNYIRLWIDAKLNNDWNDNKLQQVSDFLNHLHAIKIPQLTTFKPKQYEQFIINAEYAHYYDLYLSLLNKYTHLPLCVCHNDLNPTNILINDDQIVIVDFERVQLNTAYFDFANLARENMSLEQIKFLCAKNKLDFNIFLDHLIITCIYGLQWTLSIKNKSSIAAYQANVLNQLNRFLALAKYKF